MADSLKDTPYIHSIDLADNRLTDKGLKAILDVLVTLPKLEELDLSQNKIGKKTSKSLAAYIASSSCPLVRLVMKNSDLDDRECETFVRYHKSFLILEYLISFLEKNEAYIFVPSLMINFLAISALRSNPTLKGLDMSSNKIGSAEQLNTVMPDLTTEGEAIAEWLESPNCVLESLNLSWNMIRLDSAMSLCGALHVNHSLIHLDLSYNSLGHDGGLALGDAIIDNRTLKTLNV